MRSLIKRFFTLGSLSLQSPLIQNDAIHRDVVILGGGASGTYAAVRLHDLGYSIALIEQKKALGGHVDTYTDYDKNVSIDYGVGDYRKLDVTERFFNRLGIAYNDFIPPGAGQSTSLVDLRSGNKVTEYPEQDVWEAFDRWREQASKYAYLEHGYYLPDQIPEDLLLPFGEFVEKYNISGIVQVAYHSYGDILTKPTLYVMKYFGPNGLKNLQDGFYGTVSRNNSQIYTKAAEILDGNLILQSRIISTHRHERQKDGVGISVQTPQGVKQIQAKKLLIAAPPLLSNLRGFDLDATEQSLFTQFRSVGYYTSLVRDTGLPDNVTVRNVAAHTPYNLPYLPGLYQIVPTSLSGIFEVEYGSDSPLPEWLVKLDILATIARYRSQHDDPSSSSSSLPSSVVAAPPSFVEFQSHTPYLLTVSTDAIRSGFYKQLYDLQGQRNTYYTGAAFHAHDSALLWRFTEALIENISSDLGSPSAPVSS